MSLRIVRKHWMNTKQTIILFVFAYGFMQTISQQIHSDQIYPEILSITKHISIFSIPDQYQLFVNQIHTAFYSKFYYQFNMNLSYASVFIACLLPFAVMSASQACNQPNNIIPASFFDNIFDVTFSTLRSPNDLQMLVSDPTSTNIKNYALTFAPTVIPLWVMAGAVQSNQSATMFATNSTCLYDVRKCGNEIDVSTYSPCAVKCGCISFLIVSVLCIIICIAAMIVASDLGLATAYTSCNTQNVVTQAYQGNGNNSTMPWSGINTFNANINSVSINFQNTVPFLATNLFNTNRFNNNVGPISANYNNSIVFTCPTAPLVPITCPFASSASVSCPNPIQAVFSVNMCNSSMTNSTQSNITKEIQMNQTVWQKSLTNLQNLFTTANANANSTNVTSLTTQVTKFVDSVGTYQGSISSGLTSVNSGIGSGEIAAYVLFAFIILASLVGFVAMCLGFSSKKYSCKWAFFVLWVIFMILGVLLFVLSGFLLITSLASYDVCSAYNLYTTNQQTLKSASFYNSSQTAEIFNQCYFQNASTIFGAFNTNSSIYTLLLNINSNYTAAIPAPAFNSTVDITNNNLYGYILNPNSANLVNQNTTNSPNAALAYANNFANFSAPNSKQTCQATRDYLVYNPVYCTPYLQNIQPPASSCVQIQTNPLISTFRSAAFSSANCASNFTVYQQNYNALLNFGYSIGNLSLGYIQSASFSTYRTAYYNYWEAVTNFMDQTTRSIFLSFLTPYNNLNYGTSCTFVTASLNSLTDIACNSNFPYIHALAILTIAISALIFILMVLAFYMTTRLEYYEFIDGDYANYRPYPDILVTKDYELKMTRDEGPTIINEDGFLSSSDRRNN